MELKVWVEGIQRIVCGVTSSTTCQDVVFALAHATGKVGRFTLIERWRNNERLLAPTENPLKILLKWGEYSNDVQFILQRSESKNDVKQQAKNKVQGDTAQAENKPTEFVPLETSKNKAFGIGNEPKQVDNVGIVKGIPQKQVPPIAQVSPKKSPTQATSNNNNDPLSSSGSYVNALSSHSIPQDENLKYKSPEFNMADVRSSLDRKTSFHQDGKSMSSSENLVEVFSSQKTSTPNSSNNNNISNSISNELMPQISTNGSLVPPPYRDPPPPRTSPLQKIDNLSSKKYEFKDSLNISPYFNVNDFTNDMNENYLQSTQYKELIQLIKYQRDKISTQQSDLTKVDAEIVYLENKERDQVQQLDALAMEISKTDQILRQGTEQLQTLQYVEEENELVRQQEKTLKSEITLLRSKLANCETELLQCKNKIRLLLDDIQIEQRALNNRQKDNRQQMERSFLTEVERIQSEIDQAIQNSETSNKTMENLKKEVNLIENAIAEKKRQVEQLVNEMKEVNLQSLAVAPSDEIRHLLESSNRPGSTRRIIGSPRQLENAVPTSKNPHGVWV